MIPASEIRALRADNPANLATLCYKATERLVRAVDNSCRTHSEQQAVLNCIRLLTRVIPYIHEDNEWHDFFWSSLPSAGENEQTISLAQSLINAICVNMMKKKNCTNCIKLKTIFLFIGFIILSGFHSNNNSTIWSR